MATVESFQLPTRPPASTAPVVVCLYKATGCATDLYGRFQDLPLWQVQVVHEASDGPNVFRNMFEASVAVTAGTNRGGGEGSGPTGVPILARGRRIGLRHVSRGRAQRRSATRAHESRLGDHRPVRPLRTSVRKSMLLRVCVRCCGSGSLRAVPLQHALTTTQESGSLPAGGPSTLKGRPCAFGASSAFLAGT